MPAGETYWKCRLDCSICGVFSREHETRRGDRNRPRHKREGGGEWDGVGMGGARRRGRGEKEREGRGRFQTKAYVYYFIIIFYFKVPHLIVSCLKISFHNLPCHCTV
jgi:hypothetical protein